MIPEIYFGLWEPYTPALNVAPFAGVVFVVFGLANLHQGNIQAGWIHIFMGSGLILAGLLAGAWR